MTLIALSGSGEAATALPTRTPVGTDVVVVYPSGSTQGYQSRISMLGPSGVFNIQAYGADPTGINDSYSAIQGAINAAAALPTGGDVYAPPGVYLITSGLIIAANNVRLLGAGRGISTISGNFATGVVLTCGSPVTGYSRVSVEQISLQSLVQMTVGGYIVLMQNIHGFEMTDVQMDSGIYIGIGMNGGGAQFFAKLNNIEINGGTYGINVGIVNTVQDLFITNSTIYACAFAGLYLQNISGGYFDQIDIGSCNQGVLMAPDAAAGQIVEACFFRAVTPDTCSTYGWVLAPTGGSITDITLDACWASNCGTTTSHHGFLISAGSVSTSRISGVGLVNCISHGNAGDGIAILAGSGGAIVTQVHITLPQVSNNDKHGIEIGSGVTDFSIFGGFSGIGGYFPTNAQEYGIIINSGSSDRYVIDGINLNGNNTGPISDGGTGSNKSVTWVPNFVRSWIPTLLFGGVASGMAYGTQLGAYQVTNGWATVSFEIILTAKGTSTGAATIGGLPIAGNASLGAAGGTSLAYGANLAGLTGAPAVFTGGSSTALNFAQYGSSGLATLTHANFTDTSTITATITYPI